MLFLNLPAYNAAVTLTSNDHKEIVVSASTNAEPTGALATQHGTGSQLMYLQMHKPSAALGGIFSLS